MKNILDKKTIAMARHYRMLADHYCSLFSPEDERQYLEQLYGKLNNLRYFTAEHQQEDEQGNPFWGGQAYNWYVPTTWEGRLPLEGDYVEVENGDSIVVVRVLSDSLTLSKEDHIGKPHPSAAAIRIV